MQDRYRQRNWLSVWEEHHDGSGRVGRLQQDLVLVSNSLKRIGLVEVCRPMDESSDQHVTAHTRKLRTYRPLMEALRVYSEEGWQVEMPVDALVDALPSRPRTPTTHGLEAVIESNEDAQTTTSTRRAGSGEDPTSEAAVDNQNEGEGGGKEESR